MAVPRDKRDRDKISRDCPVPYLAHPWAYPSIHNLLNFKMLFEKIGYAHFIFYLIGIRFKEWLYEKLLDGQIGLEILFAIITFTVKPS